MSKAPQKDGSRIVVIFTLGLLFIAILLNRDGLFGSNNTTTTEPTPASPAKVEETPEAKEKKFLFLLEQELRVGSSIYIQENIRPLLVSPKSYDLSFSDMKSTIIRKEEDGYIYFVADGFFSSQNRMGAELATNYRCMASATGTSMDNAEFVFPLTCATE